MATDDEVRDAQRATWGTLSAGWETWDGVIMDQLAPVTSAMLALLDVGADQHHLDVAAGTGEPGLTIAELASGGRVVLTDLSPAMLAVADRRAAARGVTNVETRECSADALPFPDAEFDSVTVRFGLMFFPDLERAVGESVRVLRPGGRLCASVWVDPDANPWTSVAMDAIAAEVALPPPDPDGPGMYRYAAPGRVAALFEAAGLEDVAETDVEVELVTRDEAEYWAMISEHVSLAVAALRSVDDGTRARIAAAAMASVGRYASDGAVRVPGRARCVVGTRPA